MKVTILGAGLTGLSAAYHLKKNYEIFESEFEAGGLCRSFREKGFVFDYGPHLYFSKNEYVRRFINKLQKNNLHELESSAGQYSFGRYLQFPYTVNMYGAPVDVIKECISGYVEARYKKNKKRPRTYHDWCLYNFGKGYAKHFMFPYAKKAWTVNPKRMTVDWIGKRIILPSLEQILDGTLHKSDKLMNYITTFEYPLRDGMSSMISGLTKMTNKIKYNKKVIRIDIKNRKITFQDGTSSYYEKLISTIALPDMIKMIPDAPPSVREAARRLIHNSLLFVNIGVDRPRVSEFQWIYFDGDEPFNRIHFPSNLSKHNAPRGTSAINIEIAYSRFRPLDKEKALDLTMKKLKTTDILKPSDKILFQNTIDQKYAYVIFDKYRQTSVNRIRSFLRKYDIEMSGRFGEWDYLWMDQSILSGKRAAEAITATK
jgi:UDP-galactopyranose mutase